MEWPLYGVGNYKGTRNILRILGICTVSRLRCTICGFPSQNRFNYVTETRLYLEACGIIAGSPRPAQKLQQLGFSINLPKKSFCKIKILLTHQTNFKECTSLDSFVLGFRNYLVLCISQFTAFN